MTLRWTHGIAILALMVAAFAFGRWSARVPEERVELAEAEAATTSEDLEEIMSLEVERVAAHERAEERVRIVYRDRWRTPDGAERETEVEIDADTAREIVEVAQKDTFNEEARQKLEEDFVRQLRLAQEIKNPRLDWRVAGMLGYDIGAGAMVFGLSVERRILGPVHVGAWGLSDGAVGIVAGVAW